MRIRLPAGSLVLTIIIALILSILSSALILIGYYNRLSYKTDEIKERVDRNFESTVNLVLSDTAIYQNDFTDSLDLFGEGSDSVKITKSLWGIFEIARIKSFYGKFFREECFFYGTSMDGSLNACLYMADHQRPLSLVGETKLIGDAYLPKAGLKTSYIAQRGFSSTKLIDGSIKPSDQFLPVLNEEIKNNITQLLEKRNIRTFNNGKANLFNKGSILNNFKDSTLIYTQDGNLVLTDLILDGRVIIIASGLITVEPSAALSNVILVASGIVFKTGFHGKVQAIGTDSIIVQNNCIFNYPSALLLIKSESEILQNRMIIGEGNNINGLLVSICRNDDLYKSYVEIGNNTTFNGMIYSMGYLNLKTDITGIVLTDFFIYKTPSAIYENHLVDIEINRKNLSDYFLTSSIIRSDEKKGILQWVK